MTTDWFVSISCIAMTDLSTQRIHCTIGCVRSESSRVNSLQLHHRKNCVHSINLLFSNWVQVWFISVFLFCSFINVIMKCAPKLFLELVFPWNMICTSISQGSRTSCCTPRMCEHALRSTHQQESGTGPRQGRGSPERTGGKGCEQWDLRIVKGSACHLGEFVVVIIIICCRTLNDGQAL